MYGTMKVEELLDLPSTDYPGTVREHLSEIDFSLKLLESMRTDGQLTPVCVESNYVPPSKVLANGHHRLRIAVHLGWREMMITDDFSESCGNDRQGVWS